MSITCDRAVLSAGLSAAVSAERTVNSAEAHRLAAIDSYYESRMSFDSAGSATGSLGVSPTHSSVVSEVAAAFACSHEVIQSALKLWSTIRPAVENAFRSGSISVTKVRVIQKHTDGAPADVLRRLDEVIVSTAIVMAPGPLGTEIDRLIREINPTWDAEARKNSREKEPRVRIKKLPRGMASITVVATAEEAAEIGNGVHALRRHLCAFDPRTVDASQRDAFLAHWRGERLECRCGRAECPFAPKPSEPQTAPKPNRPPALLHISCDLETILGLSSGTAQVHGYGPIDAETCRRLAADATWQAIFLVGRRFLDTLTGGMDWDTDESEAPAPAGDPDEVLRRAHAREERRRDAEAIDESEHVGECAPDPEPEESPPDPQETYVDVLGRTRQYPPGYVADPDTVYDDPGLEPWSAADTIAQWKDRIAAEPRKDHRADPDGHGGRHRYSAPPGALTYRASAALDAYARAVHPTCVHPGCAVSSDRCDLDHAIEFDHDDPYEGGWTISSNLWPMCRRHHNLKTDKSWRYDRLPDGVVMAVDPLGNRYFGMD